MHAPSGLFSESMEPLELQVVSLHLCPLHIRILLWSSLWANVAGGGGRTQPYYFCSTPNVEHAPRLCCRTIARSAMLQPDRTSTTEVGHDAENGHNK